MISVWGMVTRETVAGVRGAHHAVTRDEAIALHTVEAARLLNESETRGTLAPGHLADYTVWPADPLTIGIDQLRDLMPTRTVLGGRTVHTSTA
jgi:predicted amidohydrolase YtcJ